MNHLSRFIAAAICLLVMAGPATGSPIILIGTTTTLTGDTDWADAVDAMNKNPDSYGKNDHAFNVNWLVDEYNQDPGNATALVPDQLSLLGKYEDGGWTSADWGTGSPYFTWDDSVTTGFIGTSGSWFEVSPTFNGPIFFSVKASTEFALYYALPQDLVSWNGSLVPGANWSTGDINKKAQDLSHMSFWTASEPPAPVPEPGTLVLVGLGVLGLARTGRTRMGRKPRS